MSSGSGSGATRVGPKQLQGYLLEHGTNQATLAVTGNVHFRRKRWFVFSPHNGILYSYRTSEDLFPINEIDISSASFRIKSSSCNSFQFEIVSGCKHLVLESSSSADGFNWIRTFQQYRHNYFNQYLGLEEAQSPSTSPPKLASRGSLDSESSRPSHCDTGNPKPNVAQSKRDLFQEQRASSFPEDSSRRMSPPGAKANPSNPLPREKSSLFSGFVSRIRPSLNQPMSADLASLAGGSDCARCKHLEESLVALNHDKVALEDEVNTNREVIKILQQQLRIFNNEKGDSHSGDEAASAANDLIALRVHCKWLESAHEAMKKENQALKNSKQVLEEMLESRDRTLVSLTHEVYDLESKNSRMLTHAELEREFLQDEMPKKIQQRMEQLEDTVVAFEQQNEFLNKEIIELNEIRHIMEMKRKQSESKLCEVEAKCSQIQSKLLSLLKEINQCIQHEEKSEAQEFHNRDSAHKASLFVTNESVRNLVARLLEESSLDIPLSWKPGNRPRNGWTPGDAVLVPEFDELGFYHQHDQVVSYDVVLELDKSEISWRSRWDHFMSDSNNQSELCIGNVDLKLMIRSGVPQDYRCKIWRMLIHQRVKAVKEKLADDYYESLLRNRSVSLGGSPNHHQSKLLDPAAKQIELDLLRTLPNNRHFESLESDGIGRLRRVLLAYSMRNDAVGYCQGLNRLAAVALLFMAEEDAFWCLVAIVETVMPKDYFGRNLMGAHVDQYVLRDLISDKLPDLSAHMEAHNIEVSLFAWFLTVFVDNIPVSVYLHIWDVFLCEGDKVLFRFALAILKLYKSELMQLTDSASFNQSLRTLYGRTFNLQQLSTIAFRELNPFPSRVVRQKRHHYTGFVVSELRKIEEFRESLSAASETPETSQCEPRRTLSYDDNESE